jgi:hypothetical protein
MPASELSSVRGTVLHQRRHVDLMHTAGALCRRS